jgi:hypothetical protein
VFAVDAVDGRVSARRKHFGDPAIDGFHATAGRVPSMSTRSCWTASSRGTVPVPCTFTPHVASRPWTWRRCWPPVEPPIKRLLDRRGLGDGDDDVPAPDTWADEAPVLAGLAAASVQGTVALGRHRGARLRRVGDPPESVEAPAQDGCHARANGFDLHAGLVVPAGHRERLERVCRYALRPPVTQERLHLTGEGQVRLELRQPWRGDGTTDVVFDPVEFLGRLAVLVPRPRINLILYYGVLGPRAAWRPDVVRRKTSEDGRDAGVKESATAQAREADPADTARRQARGQCWAALMQRTFGFDVLACPRCGGRLRLIALIEEAPVIGRILRHLGLPTEIPAPCPARAPPLHVGVPDVAGWDADPSRFNSCSWRS